MDTLCAWVRNDLQSAEPQKRTLRAAAGANRIHHSPHKDSGGLSGSTEGALQEHRDTSTCSSIRALLSIPLCPVLPSHPGMLQVLLLTGSAPGTSPLHSLSMYLIFAGAGHSPCLNPAQPRSVPLMGANENNKPQ